MLFGLAMSQVIPGGLARARDGVVTVRCVSLHGQPLADIQVEDLDIKLTGKGWVKLWGLPLAYPDIVTVYSGQVCAAQKWLAGREV